MFYRGFVNVIGPSVLSYLHSYINYNQRFSQVCPKWGSTISITYHLRFKFYLTSILIEVELYINRNYIIFVLFQFRVGQACDAVRPRDGRVTVKREIWN